MKKTREKNPANSGKKKLRFLPRGKIYSRSCPHDLYDLAHVAGWEPYDLRDLPHVSCGLDLYYVDPAQPLLIAAAGEEPQ